MKIKKISDIINEDKILLVLDAVIGDDGSLHSNIKGNIGQGFGNVPYTEEDYIEYENKLRNKGKSIPNRKNKSHRLTIINKIVGADNNEYPAGIDKNGTLVSIKWDGDFAINNGKRLLTPEYIYKKTKSKYWNKNIDYKQFLSEKPTGLINVKVDMEVCKRTSRYSKQLGHSKDGHKSFMNKLFELNKVNDELIKSLRTKRTRESIQKEMAVVMILYYIKEIKEFFTPTSAGFIFESFIAGLIPNGKIPDDNSPSDILANGLKYQVKFESYISTHIKINQTETVNYYIFGVKYPDKVKIYVVSSAEIGNFLTPSSGVRMTSSEDNAGKLLCISRDVEPYILNLTSIDEKIDKISKGLKECLKSLYEELSEFHYNVETIFMGVNKEGKVIDSDDFESHSKRADQNLKVMIDTLSELKGIVSPVRQY